MNDGLRHITSENTIVVGSQSRCPHRIHVACWNKADMPRCLLFVRFSNRPSGSSAFQAIHHSSVDVAHELALLFGLGTEALPSWDFQDEVEQSFGRPCRQYDGRSKRTNDLTSSVVPRGTSFHRWVELDLLLSHLILHSSQATATSLVHLNAVPSTQMRCGEIFYTLREAQIVIESWRRHYNTIRPHASIGYKPPAPEVFVPAFAAWPAALRRPASPATLAQRPTLN